MQNIIKADLQLQTLSESQRSEISKYFIRISQNFEDAEGVETRP